MLRASMITTSMAGRKTPSDYLIDDALAHIRAWGGHAEAVTFGELVRAIH